jgi:FkbM family methyltransferase
MINWPFVRQVGLFRWMFRYGALQFRKRVLKRDSTLQLPTGLKMVLPRYSCNATEIYVTNANTDWGAESIFARFADPTRDCLDIGSHIGYYAVYLAPLVRRVYAFEPCPDNLKYLRENARLTSNIEVVEMAVSSCDGEASFFSGRGTAVGSLENVGGKVVRVALTSVDSFVKSRTGMNPALIKIDIEGHDLKALQGMQATVAKFQPLILTEVKLSEELGLLCSGWNYQIFGAVRDFRTSQARFSDLSGWTSDGGWHKMIFLVPQSLQAAFAGMVQP